MISFLLLLPILKRILIATFVILLLQVFAIVPVIYSTRTHKIQAEITHIPAAQQLPVLAQVVVGREVIKLEVAQTKQQNALGLMYRNTLAKNRGMLFSFMPSRVVKFWMKNVRIPLDILFIQNERVVAIAAAVPPCDTEFCPTYGSGTKVNRVIELRGGRAVELGLKVGDRLPIEFLID